MNALIPIIAGLLLEGVKAWSEERRTRFMDEHHELLQRIETLRSRKGRKWIDSDLAVAIKDLTIFVKAYAKEIGYVTT